MSREPESIGYTTLSQAREQGRTSALAGRPIFANPHIGSDAEAWFAGYREVPEEQRGSDPSAYVASRRRKNGGKRTRSSEAGVRALGDRTLPGSTPRPWAVDGAGL